MTSYPLKSTMNFRVEESFSSLNLTSKSDHNFFDLAIEQIANALNMYYIPLLIALGAIGNLLSVFVFYRTKLRYQSTSQYLSALALSDTIFLLQLLPPWLNAVHISGLFHQQGFCQFFVYISYVTCTLSAWIVVGFTVERFLAVLYPLRRTTISAVRRARYIIAGITIGSLLINVPVLRYVIPTPNDCNIDYEYLVHAARFNIVDTVVSFTIPLALIIILNTCITIEVCRLEKARQQLLNAGQIVVLGNRAQPVRQVGCPRSQQRVTRMLLIVSSVYVILNLPAYTLRIIAYAYNTGEGENSTRWAAIQQVALVFFNTNFGINFILYCLSGQNFRRAFKNTMPRIGKHLRRAFATRRDVSSNPTGRNSATTSFMSNCNEANNNIDGLTENPNFRPRLRPEDFISRWTFDNSRQRRMQEFARRDLEMIQLREINAPSTCPRINNVDQQPIDQRLRCLHRECNHHFYIIDPQLGNSRYRSSDSSSRVYLYGRHRLQAYDIPPDQNRFQSIDPQTGHLYRSIEPQHHRNRYRFTDRSRDCNQYPRFNHNRFSSVNSPLENRRFRYANPPRGNHRLPSYDPPPQYMP